MDRSPKQLRRLSDAKISPDGLNLWVNIETISGDTFDLSIPLNELGDFIQFLVSCAEFVISYPGQSDDSASTGMQKNEWAPIPLRGIGFATGRSAEETLLVVRLAGFELAFSLESNRLKVLALDVARIATTLSSGRGKPN